MKKIEGSGVDSKEKTACPSLQDTTLPLSSFSGKTVCHLLSHCPREVGKASFSFLNLDKSLKDLKIHMCQAKHTTRLIVVPRPSSVTSGKI